MQLARAGFAIAILGPIACRGADVTPGQTAARRVLIVRHATVFDTRTRTTLGDQAIVIRGDRIVQVVVDSAREQIAGAQEIDAKGRLVTPGIIDVHHHSSYVFPDSITPGGGAVSKLMMRPDSIAAYRARWAKSYLPFGVTAVREAGGDERYLELMLQWMRPSADAPDFMPSGGALASHEAGRVPYTGHAIVRDSADAARKVRSYYDRGLRDVKLYWRLREPEYVSAFTEATRLGMHVDTHVDFGVMSVRRALEIGVKHFEHAYTLGVESLPAPVVAAVWGRTRQELGPELPAAFYYGILEHLNELGPNDPRMLSLIDELAKRGATVTPTLHIFAQHVGSAPFTTKSLGAFDRSSSWTDAQRKRAARGYETLAGYVRRMHEAGIPLAVGSDWLEPGRVCLSEIVLLARAGIPAADALAIATFGGAKVIERESDYGSIETGRKAQLVIFERNPLDDIEAVFAGKTVIKDGVVVVTP